VTDFHPECGSVARNTAAKIVYGASSNNWLFSHKQVRAARHQGVPVRSRHHRLRSASQGPSFTLRAAHHREVAAEPARRENGRPLPDRLKARSRKEPKKRESEAGKAPHFVAALANLSLASCSGKNVLGEPLTSQRATLTSPVLTKFESSLQPGLMAFRQWRQLPYWR